MNITFAIDYRRLNTIMGWDPNAPLQEHLDDGGEDVLDTSDFNEYQLWEALTQGGWDVRQSKATHIIHPAVRYLHRMLVYSVFNRHEVGDMAMVEMRALWLSTRPRHPDFPVPLNFGEKYIDRWLALQKSKSSGTRILFGGTLTRLAEGLLDTFTPDLVDRVSDTRFIDIDSLVSARSLRHLQDDDRHWIWLVRDSPWCIVPNHDVGMHLQQCGRPNPFVVERTMGGDPGAPPQPPPVIDPHPVRQRHPQHPPQPHEFTSTPGFSTTPSFSSSNLDLSGIAAQLSAIQAQLEANRQESEHQRVLFQGLYASGVESGSVQPYLNYPMWPPQQGPLPGWHGGQPTYPYHPHRPEGIDYRYPGGSDLRYDPNVPPVTNYPTYPPDYHSSVPHPDHTWGNAPPPPYGGYGDDSSEEDQ